VIIFRIYFAQICCSAILSIATFFTSPSIAQELPKDAPVPEQEDSGEETREYISEGLFSLTDEIDAWFGDVRNEEQRQDDWFRLSTEVRVKTGDPIGFGQKIRAGFNLKEFSKRLRLVIERDDGDSFDNGPRVETERDVNDYIRQNSRDGGSAAIRYFIFRDKFTQLSADAGIRFSGGPNPFGRVRASHWIELSELWSLEPSQLFFLEREEGFGSKTRFDVNRLVDANKFIRFRSEGYRSEESRGYQILEELAYFRRLPLDRSLATSFAVIVDNEERTKVYSYRSAIRYRAPLWGNWLYGILEPGIELPDDRDYRLTPFIMFRLEGRFERSRMEETHNE